MPKSSFKEHRTRTLISLERLNPTFKNGAALIEQWLRTKDSWLFLAAWEKNNNPIFHSLELEGIKNEAGRNSYLLSVERRIELTNAEGIRATTGAMVARSHTKT